jgi:hypothetical protein
VFLDKDRTMDNVQQLNACTNVPSSQTFRSYSYFKALFANTLKGGGPEINEVNLYIQGHVLNRILDCHCNVNSQNVEQLLPIADQYEILGFSHHCCQCLLEELQFENCLGILNL